MVTAATRIVPVVRFPPGTRSSWPCCRLFSDAPHCFPALDPEARAEAIQNAICNACSAVARLAELGKLDLVYPSVLANYAVAQTRDGRMLGRPLNCKDISSAYCQRLKGVVVERLDQYDHKEEVWQEILVPDRTYAGRIGRQPHRFSWLAGHAPAAGPQDRDDAGWR